MFVVETGSGRMFTSTTPQPTAPLATDWLQNAVNHYVQNFVITPDCGLPGLHDNLPHLYTLSPDKVYLQSALQAVALAHLSRVNRMGSEYFFKAQRLHSNAVVHFRNALNDDVEARSATALMTTELLWQYDVRNSHTDTVPVVEPSVTTGRTKRKFTSQTLG
jgi:hypothetical protein